MIDRRPAAVTDIPAVVIAGGRSSRMGRDKSMLRLGAQPMIARIVDRLRPQASFVSVNTRAIDLGLPQDIKTFADTVDGQHGPLAGVLSALRHIRGSHPEQSHVATVPTDTPFFPMDLLSRLAAAMTQQNQVAIAHTGGTMHPIFGLWPVSVADDLENWLLRDDKRRVRGFIARHPMVAVDFPMVETPAGPFDPFYNINTPDDHAAAERWLALLETERP